MSDDREKSTINAVIHFFFDDILGIGMNNLFYFIKLLSKNNNRYKMITQKKKKCIIKSTSRKTYTHERRPDIKQNSLHIHSQVFRT